ncbi:MAG: AMP-dependent synthetase [Rhodospirillales bacterium RIFCSPLOWO2_12_FULL_67_15]|nr:MAG: AMP-dependent synthetase [Rhodospirillales bacterium RIFCSPLOWO2_12_FULL_67_15]
MRTDRGQFERWPNLAAMFFDQVDRLGEYPFLWAKRGGTWRPLTWGDAAARVSALARGLIAAGVEPGDRVVLVSENRPAWAIADLAIMSIGAITVPAYVTNTVADHAHILKDSGAKGAIVSQRRLVERILAAAEGSPQLRFVAAMDPPPAAPSRRLRLVALDQLIETGRARHENVVEKSWSWPRSRPACVIYTSGTGGVPKGVVLSHGAILHNCRGAALALAELGIDREVFLSFLPLSHSYEHTAGQFFPIAIGAEIYYAESLDALASNMIEARPTIMTAVPRLYETLYARISRGVAKSGALRRFLFAKTLELGRKRFEVPKSLGVGARLLDAVLDRLVRDKVRARFGGRLKALVSGGAPLNPEIGMFFTALGLRILQGYGQTEAAPVISVNRPNAAKMHSVGPPLEATEVRIAGDGEILVRGESVMEGYWKNETATREAIRDGWLYTGDIGHFDADGHLVITDRKKDIIVNSGGDNLSPQRVEGLLTVEDEIAQAMVYGDRHPHLVALLVPDPDWLQAWARAHGKTGDAKALAADKDLAAALSAVVERVNAGLSPLEKIRHILVAAEPFTIENEMLTPTLKIRRHKVREVHGARLEALYA